MKSIVMETSWNIVERVKRYEKSVLAVGMNFSKNIMKCV